MLYTCGDIMTNTTTTVFANNATQAVRLLTKACLPDEVKRVMMRVRLSRASLRQ